MNFNKFLDFDYNNNVVYYNLFLNEDKFIVKIPILTRPEKQRNSKEIKIEEFSLLDYSYKYLINCDQKIEI